MTDKMLKVFDTSATAESPTRTHDVIFDGKISQVTFTMGQPVEMPMEKALKFHKEGFIVTDEEGNPYKDPVKVDTTITSRLRVGEIIARYEELEVGALRMRAAVIPDGEKLAKAKKDEVIAFLKANDTAPHLNETVEAPNAPSVENPSGDLTEETDEEKQEREAAEEAARKQAEIDAAYAAQQSGGTQAPATTEAAPETVPAATGAVQFDE